MRPTAILLRVLLCLALVANGMASAQAGVRMALAGVPAVHAAMAASCHDAPAAAADAHRVHAPATGGEAMPGHGDCCASGACECAGTPPLLASIAVFRLPGMSPPLERMPWVRDPSHPAPRLPHLIRPPIG